MLLINGLAGSKTVLLKNIDRFGLAVGARKMIDT